MEISLKDPLTVNRGVSSTPLEQNLSRLFQLCWGTPMKWLERENGKEKQLHSSFKAKGRANGMRFVKSEKKPHDHRWRWRNQATDEHEKVDRHLVGKRHGILTRSSLRSLTILLILMLVGIGSWDWMHGQQGLSWMSLRASRVNQPMPMSLPKPGSSVRVMAIGGSVALGWDDKTGGGYLQRAFALLSSQQGVKYNFFNKSVEGDGPGKFAPQYPKVLQAVRPNILVISWGMLDDIARHTPVSVFQADVHQEIAKALSSGIKVFVITPPVTVASYSGQEGVSETKFVDAEMNTARQFHSPSVYIFDLFDQMKAYLQQNHLSYRTYAADGWHPNTAGHILAAHLLAPDLAHAFATANPTLPKGAQ